MANLNTVSLADMTSLTRLEWLQGPNMVGMAASQLFIPDDLAEHTGDTKKYTEIDTEEFASVKDEGDDATLATVQQGYSKTMTVRRFAKQINVTWEMRRFNRYPEVLAQLTTLAHFCPQRKEIDLTHRLSFADSTTYTDMDGRVLDVTVGDGLALVSASHTITSGATTFSNVITGNPAFSKGGLEAAESQANTQIISHFGDRRVMSFNTIVSSDDPSTCNDIKQFLKSTSDVDQNNPNVINVYQNKYTHVILPRLATSATGANDSTKAKRWFLIASGQGARGWQAYIGTWEQPNLKTPSAGSNGENFENDDWSYGTRCAYGIVSVSPRGLLMSTGLGA